jgi:ABC-type phosphate/phosphonate transport system substrate-binding protein
MKKTLLFQLGFLMTSLLASYQAYSTPLNFGLDLTEGGRLSSKATTQFEKHMAEQNCELTIVDETSLSLESLDFESLDLYFSVAEAGLAPTHFLPALIARTINDEPLTITILIKSSTNIDTLVSIQGERLGIISHKSFLGGEQAKRLLTDAGIRLHNSKIYQTENYFGAISLLLHGDVFIAAIPGPLASQWKEHNKLSIIAESKPFQLGELFINTSVTKSQRESCTQAFLSLSKANRRDKKMDIFPAWLAGFKY